MLGQVVTIIGVIVGGLAVLAAAFLLGWRAKSPLVLGPIVWVSKRFFNRVQMKTAGQPGAYAAIIRHRGRVSGTAYETPIGAVADGDGFLVALPYGSGANWLRNVLAAGEATLVHEGAVYEVDRPELIDLTTVADRFPPSDRTLFRMMRIEDGLRLHRAAESVAA